MTRTRYRWFIIFLLFAITAVNYVDRSAISYAIPAIQRDLGLSPADKVADGRSILSIARASDKGRYGH